MKEKIKNLKNAKNAVILAHYYTTGDVQDVADFVGDSLALSVEAAKTDANIIVFAGVYFMAETAKILSPSKKVLIPDPEAGCSLAASCPTPEFATFRAQHPEAVVVSYVNTTAEIKALTDICCTSSNALSVIRSIPPSQPIIFAPDRNLGAWLQKQTGRQNMILWNGACHVHDEFSLEGILALKTEHPEALVLAHPECREYILTVADYVGSTSGILSFAGKNPATEFIVVTEPGILYEMRKLHPHKTFIPAPPVDSTCGCNDCQYMKLPTLEKIFTALQTEQPEVTVPEPIRARAEKSIRAMLAL
ncbi:MAG: quinolinate synthase NadA [Rikenellaceae bacterium]|jgi:quinolinate synthase|nr:quinolinate synthase NadA [Rikenellaceae bacterium]